MASSVPPAARRRLRAGPASGKSRRGRRLALGPSIRGPAASPASAPSAARGAPSPTTRSSLAAAHAARYPDPLIAIGVLADGGCVDLVDVLSGAVVKRVPGAGAGRVLCARSDHGVFFDVRESHGVGVLNPATGSVSALPSGAAEDLVRRCPMAHLAWFAFGQAATTGEYKLLRF